MDYYRQLASRAFWDAWDLVFNRSFASCMVGVAIFLSSLLYLRSRKRHRDIAKQLKEVGIAALFTGSAFVVLFLINFLVLAPKKLVDEAHSAAQQPAQPSPIRLDVTDVDGRRQIDGLRNDLETARKQEAEGRKELGETKAQLEKAQATIRNLDPLQQPIASVAATADVFLKSSEQFTNRFMDAGGTIAFARGSEALLMTYSQESIAKTVSDQLVRFHGFFNLAVSGSLVGKPISTLRADAEYIQIEFAKLPLNSEVLSGNIVFTINGAQRFEFAIPPQTSDGHKIFVRDLYQLRIP